MREFIRILLFILFALVANLKAVSASISFTNIQEATTTLSFYGATSKTVVGAVENDLVKCCQNEQDLVAYRNKGGGAELVAAKTGTNLLSSGELLRIENAATRIGKPITVVGSRAIPGRVSNGVNTLTGKMADWDYVIPGLNSKNWSTIKNSLPGSRSILDNTPRNIDILPGPVWPGSPHITIYPR